MLKILIYDFSENLKGLQLYVNTRIEYTPISNSVIIDNFAMKHCNYFLISAQNIDITQTRPCNIQQYFTAVKMFIFR